MNITTLSTKMKKPSKQHAQNMLKSLFEDMPDLDERKREQLAQLYAFFMPSRPAKALTGFDWVSQAASDHKDVREYLRYVYVTPDRIIATNGHRVHAISNKYRQLVPGFYLVNGEKAHDPDYARYPDVDRVIPDLKNCKAIDFNIKKLPLHESGKMLCYELQDKHGGPLYVQKKYLDQAVAGHDQFTAHMQDNLHALRIDLPEKLIVIMPARL